MAFDTKASFPYNHRNPNPWESLKRFDYSGRPDQYHFNKVLDKPVYEPHVHDR
jgi:hypothetical protein